MKYLTKFSNDQLLALLSMSFIFFSLVATQLVNTMNLLIFFMVVSLWLGSTKLHITSEVKKWSLIVIFVFCLLGLVPLIFHDASLEVWKNAFDKQVAVAVAVVCLSIILLKLKPNDFVLWIGILGSALGLILVVGLEFYTVGDLVLANYYRFGDLYGTSTLVFGMIANLLTAVFFGGVMWAVKHKQAKLALVFLLSVIFAIYSSLLTGTRGAWLGLPEILIGWGVFFYFAYLKSRQWQIKLGVLSLLIIISIFLFNVLGDKVQHRVGLAIDDVQQYIKGNPETSIGLRLVMYEVAIKEVIEHPLAGVGPHNVGPALMDGTRQVFQERFGLSREGFDSWDVHNQYLQEAFSKGFLGVFSLVFVQLYLLWFFIKRSSTQNIWATTGLIFVIASSINLMSYSWLRFHDGLFFYFIILTLLLYGASRTQDEQNTFKPNLNMGHI